MVSFFYLYSFLHFYLHRFLVAAKHVAADSDVAELTCAVEALDVACRTDVDAPSVVEQLVAADKDVAHKVVAVEASPSISVREVVEDADVTGSLNADAVIASVLDDVATDNLSFTFRHWLTSVHTIAEAGLVLHEDTVVAATYADAVRDDEILVFIATKSDTDAATSAFAFRPKPTAFYYAYIIYIYSVEEVHAKSRGRGAFQDQVVEDGIRQRAYVEGFTVGDVVRRLHLVGIDREVFEAHALDGWEVALLRAFSDEERPVRGAYHLEDGALYGDTLQADAGAPLHGGAEDVFACCKLNGATALGVYLIDKSLKPTRVVPHLRGYKVVGRLISGSMKSDDEEQKEKKPPTSLDMKTLYVQGSKLCWFSVRIYIYSVTSTKDKQKKLP